MSSMDIRCVRVYLTEHDKYQRLIEHLQEQEQVRGLTVFRGIAGFGQSGQLHSAQLLDTALDLPIVIEFFDSPERVDEMLAHLSRLIEPGHMVSWSAQLHM